MNHNLLRHTENECDCLIKAAEMIIILFLICFLFFPSDIVTGDTLNQGSAAEGGRDGAVWCGPEGVSYRMC